MSHCCVPKCTSNWRLDKTLSFHMFPSDLELRKKWIDKIRHDVGPLFKIKQHTRVCALHFKSCDYKHTLTGRKCLKPGVLPSLFEWNKDKPELRKKNTKRKRISPKKKKCSSHSSEAELQNVNLLENINFDKKIEEINEDINNTQENDCEDGNCFHVDTATQITCLRKYIASLKEELILKNEAIITLQNDVKDKNQQIYNLEQWSSNFGIPRNPISRTPKTSRSTQFEYH